MGRGSRTYSEDTYQRGIWIRSLMRYTIYGFETGTDFDRYEKLVEDWHMYFKSLGITNDRTEPVGSEAVESEMASEHITRAVVEGGYAGPNNAHDD